MHNESKKPVQIDIHKEIIEMSKLGNRNAQYKLYQLYAKAMFNVCYRILNNVEESEDMLQEVFIDVFSKLDTFRFESTFGAWLKKITVNHCINELNRKKTELSYFDDMSKFDDIEEDETIDEEKLQISVERVKKAMAQLPEGGRVVLSLYLFEGYDHQEIGEILKISESTSKTQYMRAKQRVKEILKTKYHE